MQISLRVALGKQFQVIVYSIISQALSSSP